jgi:hypothetical protein
VSKPAMRTSQKLSAETMAFINSRPDIFTEFNSPQRAAIDAALTRRLTMIQGPPGSVRMHCFHHGYERTTKKLLIFLLVLAFCRVKQRLLRPLLLDSPDSVGPYHLTPRYLPARSVMSEQTIWLKLCYDSACE